MTEREWLDSKDPLAMLWAADWQQPVTEINPLLSLTVSDRQFRLFACACCRNVWHLLDEKCRYVVEVVERYVDGLVPAEALVAVHQVMTEQDWLVSTDPRSMVYYLVRACITPGQTFGPSAISGRKLRLFACACCRQVWHLLTDERCRRCVEAAERYCDDPSAVLSPFYDDAAERFEEMDNSGVGELWQAVVARHVCNQRNDFTARVSGSILPALLRKDKVPPALLAGLLREISGNPYRQPVKLLMLKRCEKCGWDGEGPNRKYCEYGSDPDGKHGHRWKSYCPWLTPAVLGLAGAVYEGNQWVLLGILADALEVAGCDNSELLGHLREPGLHVRGCWALDLLLGKS